MRWIKILWFPVAVLVLVGVIGYSVYVIVDNRIRVENNQNVEKKHDPAKNKPLPDLVSSSAPREVVLRLQPTNGKGQVNAKALTAALMAIGPVYKAVVDGNTAKLTISNSLSLAELEERLGFQDTAIVDKESPLHKGFKLYVSGMS